MAVSRSPAPRRGEPRSLSALRSIAASVGIAAAALLAGCGDDDPDDELAFDSGTAVAIDGTDQLVLRVPRAGGTADVRPYPALDTAFWSSGSRVPVLGRVLGFDENAGTVAVVDKDSIPWRLDLRLGTVTRATRAKLRGVASADGWAIYGITDKGAVTRLTPNGEWSLQLPRRARALFPQYDGALLVVTSRADTTVVSRLIPPEQTVIDSAVLAIGDTVERAMVGDRLYFITPDALIGIRGRTMERVPPIETERRLTTLVPTPSGDRVYALTADSTRIVVVDRFREEIGGTIELPGKASRLRMDPLGRYLLVRTAGRDSIRIVTIGNDRLLGTIAGSWRADLPAVTPDGAIAVARGNSVVFVDPRTREDRNTVRDGAKDFWHFFAWNGFRPRAEGLDEPVEFTHAVPRDTLEGDSLYGTFPEDSTYVVRPPGLDTLTPERRVSPFASQTPESVESAPPVAAGTGFLVSFAALLNEERARDLAASIRIDGRTARVMPSHHGASTVYRVVLGPYATRPDAERVGRAAGRSYWIFQERP